MFLTAHALNSGRDSSLSVAPPLRHDRLCVGCVSMLIRALPSHSSLTPRPLRHAPPIRLHCRRRRAVATTIPRIRKVELHQHLDGPSAANDWRS